VTDDDFNNDGDGATGDKVVNDGKGATGYDGNNDAKDVDDDNKGDGASSTTCDEGDNRNRDDGKDTCALMATTPAHRQRQRHSQS
jgi:hypothetical protein